MNYLSLFPILSTKSEEFQQFCLDLDKNNKYLSFAFKFGQNTTQGQIMSMDTYCVAENYMKFFAKQEQQYPIVGKFICIPCQ